MRKFTPGPLVARRINSDPKPFAVINPNGPFGDEIVAGFLKEADAVLYAAASDLLAALKRIVKMYDVTEGYILDREINQGRAAIAKATGES